MFESYLVRQPIFNVDEQLIGYELLYRDDRGDPSAVDGDQATTEAFIKNCIETGLSKLVGHHQAFINVTRDFIINHDQLPLSSHELVLEVYEDVGVDDEISEAVKALIKKGYHIALDDFDINKKNSGLIQLSDIVKIDIHQHNIGALSKLIASFRSFPVKLLAKNVETIVQYDRCRALGFDYYQGNYLFQPMVMRGRRLPANNLHVMQLLAVLQKNEIETNDLEKIIEQDVALSYKLLSYINSASVSIRRNIESIRHAVVILGLDEIKKWASMIALSSIKGKPNELFRVALLRAKMCELLTDISNQENKGSAFMVGLFSTLDILMGAPFNELLATLQITGDIKNVLLYRSGPYNPVLSCVFAYEKGDWQLIGDTGFSQAEATSCYLQAVEWCNESSGQLLEKAA